jgi:glutamate N-acetyltransferase / amino-acid N-acetyltransferase
VSVTAARGFSVAIGEAGIRASGGPDIVVIASDRPASAAATFTTNLVRAAPVIVAEEALSRTRGMARAVVVNAGCANAGTGAGGLDDALAVVTATAGLVGCAPDEVLPASTGLIGSRLPVPTMVATIAAMAFEGTPEAGARAAGAIMTTDTRPKERAATATLAGGREVRVGGMAKGAGMIHPQMATMLAFLTTDAPIAAPELVSVLRPAVERTFNQVTVDGDTSTNDAVIVLANGAAGGDRIVDGRDLRAVAEALDTVSRELAIAIAADGEGARHLIEVSVTGADDDPAARAAARTVAASSLVKTAVHGADPNWGRIAAAAGRSGVALDPERLRICIGGVAVFDGSPVAFDEGLAREALQGSVVRLSLDLGIGTGRGSAWGCDLSAEYVAINSEYTT